MKQIARKPAQRECRRIAAAEDHGARAQEIIDDRAVRSRHQVFLQPRPVAGRKACLIDIDFRRHRNAGQRARVIAAADHLIDRIGALEHELGPVLDDGVELGIDGVKAVESSLRSLAGGRLARAHELRKLGCGKAPEFAHDAIIPEYVVLNSCPLFCRSTERPF